MTAIITAVFGDYDEPKVQPEIADVDEWILVTDNPAIDAPGWNVKVCNFADFHPRLTAKIPKFMPWLFTDQERSIWIDGSAQIVEPQGFVEWAYSTGRDVAMHAHPQRNNIWDESKASTGPKYDFQPIAEQVDYYSLLDPDIPNLWATGCIAWTHSPLTREFGSAWFNECFLWSTQDQLSLPWLAKQLGVKIGTLPGDLWKGRLRFAAHNHGS